MGAPGLTLLHIPFPALRRIIALLLALLICAPTSQSLLACLVLTSKFVALSLVAVISALITLLSGASLMLRTVPVPLLLTALLCAVISLSFLVSQIFYQLRKAAIRRTSAAATVSPSLCK